MAEVFTGLHQWPRHEARSLRHLTISPPPFSIDCEWEMRRVLSPLMSKHSQQNIEKTIFITMKKTRIGETGNWRNKSLLMTRGSGSGWLIFPDLHTLTLATHWYLHPGARVRMILTGARGLQGSWLSTLNYNPRKGHSFQFVTSILRRNYRSDRVRCVKMLLWLSPCHPSWVWAQDVLSQWEVRLITRGPMRSQSRPPASWASWHVMCDTWAGVTWQGGVTSCDVLTGATSQLFPAIWLVDSW